MRIVYAKQEMPVSGVSSVFLAGPTPRMSEGEAPEPSWRAEAIQIFEEMGYEGDLFIPEPDPSQGWDADYYSQIDWECEFRRKADIILFWVPRELTKMPAFTTNIEFGEDLGGGNVFYGRPDISPKNRYLDARYEKDTLRRPHNNLRELIEEVIDTIGDGALRKGGERSVPLWVWNTYSFQSWYTKHKLKGNRIDDFRVREYLRRGPHPDQVFGWLAWADIWVESEKRNKSNESVLARTDTAMVVPFLTDTEDMDVLMTNEFRSAVNNHVGKVVEPPAGSSNHTVNPLIIGVEEMREETGFEVSPERLLYVGTNQASATMLTHKTHVYTLLLTSEESREARLRAEAGEVFGVNPEHPSGERITTNIVPFGKLLDSGADWAVIGAVMMSREHIKKRFSA